MIMVIFGAGASYDSVPALPITHNHIFRPPLANQLFRSTDLVATSLVQFPECLPIVPYLRSVPDGTTFEHVLQGLQADGEKDPERRRQMAAVRFYLQSMIWDYERRWHEASHGITNYVTLIDQLRRSRRPEEPVLLVTFNYDELIERALVSVGVEVVPVV